MGNSFETCCANSKPNLTFDDKFFANPKLASEQNPKNSNVNLQDFKRLKVLGQGALGIVYLVEMRKTSFSLFK